MLYRSVVVQGYQKLAIRTGGTALVRWRSQPMITHGPDEALKLRALAARFRALAAETVVEPYCQKFEDAAAELEQAALVEERCTDLKRVS
jgi:hypothetical protein